MILEYAALTGTLVMAGGVLALVAVLVIGGRPNDDGVFQVGELAAMSGDPGGDPWPPGPGGPVAGAAVVAAELAGTPGSGTATGPFPAATVCPDCHGRRCAAWRHRGTRCGDRTEPGTLPAYAVGLPLPRDGRHATSVVVARWLAGDWWETPMPVRLRRQLARMVGATRVPVQLGFPLRQLP